MRFKSIVAARTNSLKLIMVNNETTNRFTDTLDTDMSKANFHPIFLFNYLYLTP